jgi:hypothetical protein
MATTVQEVFNLTMALIDEILDSGIISTADTISYQVRTPSLISLGQTEIAKILSISDYSAKGILPYFLATKLMIDENPDTASYFNGKYEELKRTITKSEAQMTDNYYISDGMTGDVGW